MFSRSSLLAAVLVAGFTVVQSPTTQFLVVSLGVTVPPRPLAPGERPLPITVIRPQGKSVPLAGSPGRQTGTLSFNGSGPPPPSGIGGINPVQRPTPTRNTQVPPDAK
jgi:hypothetical protein